MTLASQSDRRSHRTDADSAAPRLSREHGPARLVVEGAPFLIRGVELHNSASSGALEQKLRLARDVNANTVLAAVTWEDVEPREGDFDLDAVTVLVETARAAQVRLVLLWFGAWKNGGSSYAPLWVRQDTRRFTRCALADGSLTETLTPFGSERLDEAAFLALAEHVERIDGEERTVLMIQVENEVGLLGDSRDRSDAAAAAFERPVPPEVRAALAERGADAERWDDVLDGGIRRDEVFMAWGIAAHVERLAGAARAVTPLPFFVNAWLDSEIVVDVPGFDIAGGQAPGTYPSGGPITRVADIWQRSAPTIDLRAPDYYFGEPETVFGGFLAASDGLFIPEMRRDEVGVGHIFQAVGQYRALGTSPFGYDSADEVELLPLADAYGILREVETALTDADGASRPALGFALTAERPTFRGRLGDHLIEIARYAGIGIDPRSESSYGMVVQTAPDEFVAAGRGFRVTVGPASGDERSGIAAAAEIERRDLPDLPARARLNGDETAGGTAILHPALGHPGPSPFPIPAQHRHTGITRFSVYRYPSAATPAASR